MFTEGNGTRHKKALGNRSAKQRRHFALFVNRNAAHGFDHHGLNLQSVKRRLEFFLIDRAAEAVAALLCRQPRNGVVLFDIGLKPIYRAADVFGKRLVGIALCGYARFDHLRDHRVQLGRHNFPDRLLLEHIDVGLGVDDIFIEFPRGNLRLEPQEESRLFLF